MKRLTLLLPLALALSCSSQPASTVPEETPVEQTHAVESEAQEPAGSTDKEPALERSTKELGREATEKFHAGELEPLHARFSDQLKAALPPEKWTAAHQQITVGLGEELELVKETETNVLGSRIYRRQVRFANAADKVMEITWAFGSDGTIESFAVAEPVKVAESDYLDYETRSTIVVPFEGEWDVVWGGRTIEENKHARVSSQRFALDLLVIDDDGKSHAGDGTKNEQYYAWGKKVFAPAAGKVVAMANDVKDNLPGTMNREQLLGNYVFIDHGNGEHSLLAHFQEGSVAVKKGDELEAGDLLGLVGNSGNTSEAHIHYHLETGPEPLKGDGLPIQFDAATIDGEVKEGVELVQGMKVAPGVGQR